MRDTDSISKHEERITEIDWLQLDRMEAVHLEFPEDGIGIRLIISSYFSRPDGNYPVVLQFDGVRDLKLPVLTGAGFSFGELVVEDVTGHQLEGVRFRAKDFLSDISFYYAKASILSSWPGNLGDD